MSAYSRTSGTGHTGSYFAKSTGNGSISQTVSGLTAGYYVVSAYVNTSAASGSSGTVSFGSGQALNYKSDGWERIWTTVQVTGSSCTVTISSSGFGSGVYIDDVQLEPCIVGTEGAPSNVNLLDNGTMSASRTWSLTNAAYSSGTLKMNAGATTTSYATQTVTVNQPGTQTYMLSGWAKAESGPLDAADRFALKATIKYTDNTTETFTDTFCKDFTGWQYLALPIVPAQRTKTVSVITVYLNYNYNLNTAYFDKIALVKEEAASYKYNDNGDLVSAASSDTDQQSYSYSGADLISQTTMGNGNYTYTYDSKHNVLTAKNDGVTMTMAYDSAGNTTSSILTNATDSTKITSSATYTNNNNLLLKSTDSRGYSTEYTYSSAINKQLNIPSAVKDAKGITRNTAVNAQSGRTTQSYLSGKVSVAYGYSGGVLSTITRTGYLPGDTSTQKVQTYTMAYNAFDQLTSVKVGTTTLATYTYARPDGLMTQMKYGNNHVVNYTYDALERPATVKYNDGTTFTYTYNGLGGLGKLKDSRGREYVYNYDSLGRLISMREFNGSTIIQSMSSDYDSSNRVSTLSYKLDPNYSGGLETARTYGYTYNNADGTITTLTGPGGRLAYSYDNLNRLKYKNTYNAASGGSVVVGRQYGYLAGSGTNVSSNLVGSLILKNGSTVYSSATYGYDALGNITSITDSYLGNRSYTYDDQGQMLTETRGGVTYTYSYDTYGNIRTVKQGSTTVGTYTYGDGQWLDKLTKYNTTTINYDGAGNPTNWPGISSLTWSNGKQLTGATVSGTSLTFTYDVDGLRLTKNVGSTAHKYIWQSDRLVSENWGSNELEFFYDESGTPYAFDYNGTMYYYITNLQGDVIAITNSSGTVVATYEYDAWGKLVSTAPTSGSIGAINPLRYRGYYYDSETGLYYLQSRYYDPEVCRFINADEYTSTGCDYLGCNMFAYCNNNPVNHLDLTGSLLGAIVGGIVGGLCGAISAAIAGTSIAAGATTGAVAGIVVGAIGDTIATGGLNLVAGALICGFVSAAANLGNQYWNYSKENRENNATSQNTMQTDVKPGSKPQKTFWNSADYWSVATSGITGTIFPALGAGGGKLAELAFKGMGGAVNEIAKGISSTISNISAALLQFTAEQMIGTMI